MPDRSTVLLFAGVALVRACSGADRDATPQELPVMALEPAPTLEIGVLDGDERYIFENVSSVLRLVSGEIAVGDGGTSTVGVYGADGAFLRSFGGKGEGPGEFRAMGRLYRRPADSILALDNWTARLSLFDANGAFDRQVAAEDMGTDTVFRLDVWLHGRWWVDGGLGDEARAGVRSALSRLPEPSVHPGYRYVKIANDGSLWIREPEVTAERTRTWVVAGADGTLRSLVDLPTAFEPMHVDGKELLGRWTGESDVHFVRAYRLQETGEVRRGPSWLVEPDTTPRPPRPSDEEFMASIRGSLRNMAMAQEIHYSKNYTYTSLVDSLEWERPEGLDVDVIEAGPRGWTAVFTHAGLDRICGLGYGATVPPGWLPGSVVCGPSARPEPETGA